MPNRGEGEQELPPWVRIPARWVRPPTSPVRADPRAYIRVFLSTNTIPNVIVVVRKIVTRKFEIGS